MLLVVASFPAEDEGQSGQPPDLSAGSVSGEFNGPQLWVSVPPE